jgi:hypothetical protein
MTLYSGSDGSGSVVTTANVNGNSILLDGASFIIT